MTSMTTITCNCKDGNTQILLSTRIPRATCECCCVDCFQKNEAPLLGPATPKDLAERKRAPTLLYFDNQILVTRGEVAFEKLRAGANSTNMVCSSCRTVLCVDHVRYKSKVVLIFPDWATVENYEVLPPMIRWFTKDWSKEELERLTPLPLMHDKDGNSTEARKDVNGRKSQAYTPKDGYASFQSLQNGKGVAIIGLAEDDRSSRLQTHSAT